MIRTLLLRFAVSISLAAAMVTSANAAAQYCSGTVAASFVDKQGGLFISGSWRSDYTQVCDVNSEWKGITADICVAWLARLDAAVSLNKSVTIYYQDAVSCSALPTYQYSPSPHYVMLTSN